MPYSPDFMSQYVVNGPGIAPNYPKDIVYGTQKAYSYQNNYNARHLTQTNPFWRKDCP